MDLDARHVSPRLRRQRRRHVPVHARSGATCCMPGGRICTVASVAGLRGEACPGRLRTPRARARVLALTKNAARALADKGIAVNTIAPGATMTPMIAHVFADEVHRKRVESMSVMNRAGKAEEIAPRDRLPRFARGVLRRRRHAGRRRLASCMYRCRASVRAKCNTRRRKTS